MQYFLKTSVFLALVAAINAIQVTSPAKDAKVDLSKENTITWSSVSSDPSTFSIELVNMSVNPSVTIPIADDVKTSDGSFKVPAQKDVTSGGAYQINFVSKTPGSTGILAQSQQFTVSGSASSSGSSSSASTSSASSASGAASSASASASSAGASASSAASSATKSASSAASSASAAASSATKSAASATASGNAAASMHLASGAAGLGLVGAVVALFA